ncbi:MAG: hypothetical protein P4M13_01545 [Alphaproteobacteria bacterium]|nr:hypothetical protein [Alphaproteobacteria bacterium]
MTSGRIVKAVYAGADALFFGWGIKFVRGMLLLAVGWIAVAPSPLLGRPE